MKTALIIWLFYVYGLLMYPLGGAVHGAFEEILFFLLCFGNGVLIGHIGNKLEEK